jgi:hypothetical protein
MFKLSQEYLRKIDSLYKDDKTDELLLFLAELLIPLTAEECRNMHMRSTQKLQMVLLDLAIEEEHFVKASQLLARIYFDDSDEDSVEHYYKNSFALESDIPLAVKKNALEMLIMSSEECSVELAFCILDEILPCKDAAYQEYLLTLLLQAMQNPAKHPIVIARVKNLVTSIFPSLYKAEYFGETLSQIIKTVGFSNELLTLLVRVPFKDLTTESKKHYRSAIDALAPVLLEDKIAFYVFTDALSVVHPYFAQDQYIKGFIKENKPSLSDLVAASARFHKTTDTRFAEKIRRAFAKRLVTVFDQKTFMNVFRARVDTRASYVKDFATLLVQVLAHSDKAGRVESVRIVSAYCRYARQNHECDPIFAKPFLDYIDVTFFDRMRKDFFEDESLFMRSVKRDQVAWTPLAMSIFKDYLPWLPAKDVHELLSTLVDIILEHQLNMDDQKQLFTSLLEQNLSVAVTDWAAFNLENLSPPSSPSRSYLQTSPVVPCWRNTHWVPVKTWEYKATTSEHALQFKEIENSNINFCPFQAFGTSRDEVGEKLRTLNLALKVKTEDHSKLKAELERLVGKNPSSYTLWHSKDIKKESVLTASLHHTDSKFMELFAKKKIYENYLRAFSDEEPSGDMAALVEFAKLEKIKVCFWQHQNNGSNELIMLDRSHDDLTDSETKHFLLKGNALTLIYRTDIQHQINVVLSGMSMGSK